MWLNLKCSNLLQSPEVGRRFPFSSQKLHLWYVYYVQHDSNPCDFPEILKFHGHVILYMTWISEHNSNWQCFKRGNHIWQWQKNKTISARGEQIRQKSVWKWVISDPYTEVLNNSPICWVIKRTFHPLGGCSLDGVTLQSHKMASNGACPLTAHGVAFVRHCTRSNLCSFKWFLQLLHTG